MSEQVAEAAAQDAEQAGTAPAEDGVNTHGEHDRQSWSNPEEAGSGKPTDNGTQNKDTGLLQRGGTEAAPDFTPDPAQAADPSKAPSTVERPAHIPEQFWNAQTGAVNDKALATSYNDLRKQFNKMSQEAGGKAPEDFEAYLEDFKPPMRSRATGEQKEGDVMDRFPDMDAADPVFKVMAKAAKNANLSKGQFDDLMQDVMEGIHPLMSEPFNAEKEMTMLGDNADQLIKMNGDWVNRLASRGVINENQYNLMLKFGSTAEGVLLTNALRIDNGEKPIPVNSATVATGRKTPAECQAMMADKRYNEDTPAGEAYRATVEKAFAETYGTKAG